MSVKKRYVYIVLRWLDYDGSYIHAVFSDRQSADACCKDCMLKYTDAFEVVCEEVLSDYKKCD